MNRFKNILVFSDGGLRSRIALERAATLAEHNHAQVTVLSVVEELPRELLQLGAAVDSTDLWELALKERRQKLDRLTSRTSFPHGDFIKNVLSGSPSDEIIKDVLRRQYDLVMMAADGTGGFREVLFGSISTDLMRECPCPVWVMKSGRRKKYSRILAAVDPVPSDDDHNSLNIKIVELAASLARLEGSELHIIHAWIPDFKGIWSVGTRLNEAETDQIDWASKNAHSKWFEELLAKVSLDNLKVKRHMIKGVAGELIPKLAMKLGVDVIILGTVCRAGVPGLVIGNTAEKVLQRVSCSVLTVKPEGFVTPVDS